MIDIHKIGIEAQMRISAHLNRGISRNQCPGARREGHLGEQAKRCHCDFGEGFRSEALFANDYFLDFSVGRLLPVGGEGYHVSDVWLTGICSLC